MEFKNEGADLKNLLRCVKGDIIEFTGYVYTARDVAHKRLCECIKNGTTLPFDLKNSAIFYTGPTETKSGEIIGSCGPTTSARMDDYTPMLLEHGLKIMIGKGNRSTEVREAIKKYNAVYFCAVGGAGALIKSCVKSSELIAYPDLMTEAVRKLYIEKLPLLTAIDSNGNSIF